MKSSSGTVWSNCVSDRGMKPCKLKRNFWLVSLERLLGELFRKWSKSTNKFKKLYKQKTWNHITGPWALCSSISQNCRWMSVILISYLKKMTGKAWYVFTYAAFLCAWLTLPFSFSNVDPWQHHASFPKPQSLLRPKLEKRRLLVAQILPQRLCTGLKLKGSLMKRKNSSTLRRISQIRPRTIGKTNTDLANQDISIVCTLVMNGINTTRLTTSMFSFFDIDDRCSRLLSTDNPPPKVVQGYKVRISHFVDDYRLNFVISVQYLLPRPHR